VLDLLIGGVKLSLCRIVRYASSGEIQGGHCSHTNFSLDHFQNKKIPVYGSLVTQCCPGLWARTAQRSETQARNMGGVLKLCRHIDRTAVLSEGEGDGNGVS
jgi:hypothetical protein